jgi:shikimate dehydrogenase
VTQSFLIGLIGEGIAGSRSPDMHQREADSLGLRLIYQRIDLKVLSLGLDALPDLLLSAERMGFNGLNITYPAKQAVIPLLTELSSEARAIGAVNTVVLRDGQRIGHNTDAWGFSEGLRRALPDVSMQRVIQVGAGGAGAATAYALLMHGARDLAIHDRDLGRAGALAARLATQFPGAQVSAVTDAEAAVRRARGLVNATPVGMTGHAGLPLPADWLRPDLWVADVVYVPSVTELIARAEAIGAPNVGGVAMAAFQAARAFELFTGQPADVERMLASF